VREIVRRIGRAASTVSRELHRNALCRNYDADLAHASRPATGSPAATHSPYRRSRAAPADPGQARAGMAGAGPAPRTAPIAVFAAGAASILVERVAGRPGPARWNSIWSRTCSKRVQSLTLPPFSSTRQWRAVSVTGKMDLGDGPAAGPSNRAQWPTGRPPVRPRPAHRRHDLRPARTRSTAPGR
jgi:hypothetical protein